MPSSSAPLRGRIVAGLVLDCPAPPPPLRGRIVAGLVLDCPAPPPRFAAASSPG
ncbi:hypothetical protein BZL30_4116 [Mycobacterium kansasii]|uniref:Uncharacterized protein n=1 Tax=Mycobacterium kansasii TaxID=1768 RepID=A0A1V3X9U8_MYCKA|nr:hypothetical protein BZL30_4116 [Mycobacterium kansasii]